MIVPSVFMDNGAGVNICTLKADKKMGIDMSRITKADESALTLTIEIWTGPLKTYATFLVMDIASSFNLLLGHPWMHNNGIGTYSLHQKARFWMGNKLITVHADDGEDEIRSHQVSVDMVPEIHNYTTEIRHVSEAEASSRRACTGQFKYRNRNIPKMLQKSNFFPWNGTLALTTRAYTTNIDTRKKGIRYDMLGVQLNPWKLHNLRKKQEDRGSIGSNRSSFQKWFVRKGEERFQHQAHQI
ncbi:hypothetical protein MKW92_033919 [Papaver armeniacum]|nr:hypothetical protein MKW92_033919 [Papaver armeniacum]